jgi:hypothetical protein
MHVLLAVVFAVLLVFGFLDIVMFALRLNGPLVATGEMLLFLATLGQRRRRFSGRPNVRPSTMGTSDLRSLLGCALLGASFWLLVALAAWFEFGPIKPIQEW